MVRNLDSGTSTLPIPSDIASSPPSGSRFSVLADVPEEQLDVVARDSGVVFHGECGPSLE